MVFWFFFTSLAKALLPQLLSLARRPALERVLAVFYVRIRGTAIFVFFSAAEFFCNFGQIRALPQFPLSAPVLNMRVSQQKVYDHVVFRFFIFIKSVKMSVGNILIAFFSEFK